MTSKVCYILGFFHYFCRFLGYTTEARTVIRTLPGQFKFTKQIWHQNQLLHFNRDSETFHIPFFKVLSHLSSNGVVSTTESQKIELEKTYYIFCSTFLILENASDGTIPFDPFFYLILKTSLNWQDFSMFSLIYFTKKTPQPAKTPERQDINSKNNY